MNLELLGIYTSFGILQSYDQVQRIELSINSMRNARYDTRCYFNVRSKQCSVRAAFQRSGPYTTLLNLFFL